MSLNLHHSCLPSWKGVALVGFAAVLFAACGDDGDNSTSLNDSISESDMVVAVYDDLPVCSGKREGAIAYVKDEKAAYICEGGDWALDNDSGKAPESAEGSSSSKAKSSSSRKGDSSSSSEDDTSSSGETTSSSSVAQGDSKLSSSSEAVDISSCSVSTSSSSIATPQSSSSEVSALSSSSVGEKSSSSETVVKSSSSVLDASSSSLVIPDGWSWDVPKEARLDPIIPYGTMTDTRDGKIYKTVKIGNQTWMAENLNYYDATDLSVKAKSWCYGKKDNGDSSTCDVTGRLYTWAAAIDSVKLATDADNPRICGYARDCSLPDTVRGICPLGWHLPNLTEWNTLLSTEDDETTSGKMLKSASGWNKDGKKSGNGTNAVGFSALPAGQRTYDGHFEYAGYHAFFWSASVSIAFEVYDADLILLSYENGNASLHYNGKGFAFSVRCLKDSE